MAWRTGGCWVSVSTPGEGGTVVFVLMDVFIAQCVDSGGTVVH